MEKLKILGIVVAYNEEMLIPYVMPYYERMGIDKLIVYDNHSTDKTVELLSKYPFVEIRPSETDFLNDEEIINIKNEAWKPFVDEYDWCICADFDEVLYSERDFKEVLHEKMCEGKTYFLKIGLNVFSRNFPPTNNGKLIHENIGFGSTWVSDDNVLGIYGNKIQLFNMKKVGVSYMEHGCHNATVNGYDAAQFDDGIGMFHLKFIDFDYIANRNKRETGKKENLENTYSLMEKRKIPISEYMSLPQKKLCPQQVLFMVNENDLGKKKEITISLKDAISNVVDTQFGLIFYDDSFDKSNTIFDYGVKNNVFVRECTETNNSKGAMAKIAWEFNNLKYNDPWIYLYDGSIFNDELISKICEDVKKAQNAKLHTISDDFMRLSRFISNRSNTTLGCYMIVKNEEHNIGTCLESLYEVCDQIVVVDTGSKDDTISIAYSYPKTVVYTFDWVGDFSAARNFAMSKIKTDYCFTVDADEILTPELIKTILNEKNNGFGNRTNIEIWLLNYNGTDNLNYYLGGRQIVKNDPNNIWKYKVHEKLYFNKMVGLGSRYLIRTEGIILHKHKIGAADSNYNKYAEVYFDELTRREYTSPYYTAHFFYYMFLTLKDIDAFASKMLLYYTFKKERIGMDNEVLPTHLYRDGYISLEEYSAFLLIANGYETGDIAETFKEEFPKFILLKNAYENNEQLSLNGFISLAFISYTHGFIKDFYNITHKLIKNFGDNDIVKHNFAFCNNYLEWFMHKPLVIDCTDGTNGLASNIYYFSKMFNNIKIRCNDDSILKNFDILGCEVTNKITEKDLVVDGNRQMNPKLALTIFERNMYMSK